MAAEPQEEARIRGLIKGIENSIEKTCEVSDSEKEIISAVNEFIYKHDGIEKAQNILEQHVGIAMQAISALPESTAKERLMQLVQYVGSRNV